MDWGEGALIAAGRDLGEELGTKAYRAERLVEYTRAQKVTTTTRWCWFALVANPGRMMENWHSSAGGTGGGKCGLFSRHQHNGLFPGNVPE